MDINMNDWNQNFKGRCVACANACPSTRKNEMICQLEKARNKGLPSRPGGSWNGEAVSKLFGCVYFMPILNRNDAPDGNQDTL